jgi:hypothetical protein
LGPKKKHPAHRVAGHFRPIALQYASGDIVLEEFMQIALGLLSQ